MVEISSVGGVVVWVLVRVAEKEAERENSEVLIVLLICCECQKL